MLQNDLLEVSWRDFWARSQKAWFLEPYQSVVRIYVYMHGFWNPISQLFAYTCICMVFGTVSVSCSHICVYAWFLEPYQSVVRIYVYAWFLEPYQSVVRIYVYIHGFWNPISQLFVESGLIWVESGLIWADLG